MYRIDPNLYHEAPYFQARMEDQRLETRGIPICNFGHRIQPKSRGEDDGIYGEWSWDGACLQMRGDRYGMYPLFYACSGNTVSVSTSCFKLVELGVAPSIDWPALAVFLRIGCFVGDDTVFSSIRVLPPAGKLKWEQGSLQVAGSASTVRPHSVAYRAAVDTYVALFETAIARRLPDDDRVALPLSGGRDSRHILFELCKQGRPPKFCITGRRFPPDQREDERIAAAIAACVGVRHTIVGPPRREIESLVAANVKTNMTAPRRGWKMAIVDRIVAESICFSYDGIGGDMLSGGSALTEPRVKLFEAGRYEEFCRHVFGRSGKRLAAVAPEAAYRRMDDAVATQRLLPELAKHSEAANPTTSFYFWNRTRRFDSTNPYGMLLDVPVVYSPFLDRDLAAFLLGLPSEIVFRGKLHDDVILRAYPEYAHIPFEKKYTVNRDARRARATTIELAGLVAAGYPSELVRRSFLLPRLGARFSSLGYGGISEWWVPTITYLSLLDAVAHQGAIEQIGDSDWKAVDRTHS